MKTLKTSFRLLVIFALSAIMLSTSCKKESKEKKILSFQFTSVSPIVSATINESAKTITADFPVGTVVTNLAPSITISDEASISPASGVAQNFSTPLTYTVTAEDGSTTAYIVTVTVGGGSPLDPTTLSGNMSVNTTLPNKGSGIDYIIDGNLTITGNALLTIEPGVKILFTGTDGGITVQENAGLRMVGTAADPIIFSGPVNNPNIGSWYGLDIYSNRADNEFGYVQFINGGSNSSYSVINLWGSAQLKMSNCVISGSLGNGFGIYSSSKSTVFTGNTIEKCAKYPIESIDLNGIIAINGANTFQNNTKNSIFINSSANLTEDATLNYQSIPYYFDGGLIVTKFLTIQAGTTLAFGNGTVFTVEDGAKVIANGTSTNRITFTGNVKEANYWNYVWIKSALACVFENCDFEYGGKDYSMFYIEDGINLTLTNNIFRNSTLHGGASRASETCTGITASGNTFSNCLPGNVYNRAEDTYSTNF